MLETIICTIIVIAAISGIVYFWKTQVEPVSRHTDESDDDFLGGTGENL